MVAVALLLGGAALACLAAGAVARPGAGAGDWPWGAETTARRTALDEYMLKADDTFRWVQGGAGVGGGLGLTTTAAAVRSCAGLLSCRELTMALVCVNRWHDTGHRLKGPPLPGYGWDGAVLNITSQRWLSDEDVSCSVWTHNMVIIVSTACTGQGSHTCACCCE